MRPLVAVIRTIIIEQQHAKMKTFQPYNSQEAMTDQPDTIPPTGDDDSRKTVSYGRPRILSSLELLQGAREVWIEHGSEMYRLRVTASGKLYLTK